MGYSENKTAYNNARRRVCECCGKAKSESNFPIYDEYVCMACIIENSDFFFQKLPRLDKVKGK